VFERELVAVPGIVEALDEISLPVCVASSGSHEKMRFTLGKTGLFNRFDGRIFSVDQVAQGKPSPDIFLFAANQMGALPNRCAIVEDSVSGVTAGLSAGMAVFAFAGGVTSAETLSIKGAVVFDDMRELPAMLEAL
jgi:HAD superfamily hydrolase (TIGR01509 family)